MERDGTSDFVPSLFLSKYRVSQNIPRSYKKQIPYRHTQCRADRIFPEIHLHHTRRDLYQRPHHRDQFSDKNADTSPFFQHFKVFINFFLMRRKFFQIFFQKKRPSLISEQI